MVLGQYEYNALLVGARQYLVSKGMYWLILGGTDSIEGGTGGHLVTILYQYTAFVQSCNSLNSGDLVGFY